MAYPDGTLLRSARGPEIYMVLSGRRRWIPDPKTFERLRCRWLDVIEVGPDELEEIPEGTPFPAASSPVISGTPGPINVSRQMSQSANPGAKKWLKVRVVTAISASGAILVAATLFVPQLVIPHKGLSAPELLNAEGSLRASIVQLIGGAVLAAGLYFTLKNLQLGHRNYKATNDAQLTGRIARAVEQLSNTDRVQARLGGVMALERIARDSDVDKLTMLEIFAATLATDEGGSNSGELNHITVGADMYAALRAIGRIGPAYNEAPYELDLTSIALPGASVLGADFSHVNFSRAKLERSTFLNCKFRNAVFVDTNLTGADLRQCDFTSAIFRGTQLEGADLAGANMCDAVLAGTNMKRSILWNCDLSGASLLGVDMTDCVLRSTDLRNVMLDDTNLHGARADIATRWPVGFDPVSAGIVITE